MSDVDFLSPRQNQCILVTHIEAISRASKETGIIDGNRVIPSDPASMTVVVQEGRIKIAGAPIDAAENSVELNSAHATLPRIDIVYRDVAGDVAVLAGTPAAVEDPKGLADWKSYTSPVPPADVPAGAIIGAIYVPAACSAITASYIWMFAGGVGDIATVVADPGVDSRPATEKAVRDAIDTCAPAAQGVTNGNTHDHYGGDGGQISHIRLSNIGTNSHTAIDSHIASTSNPHGATAAQVGADITTGTTHAAASKATPVDADEIGILDSAASNVLKKLTWANLKATLLATLHSATSKATPVDADELQILDSAASYGQKKLTWANLKAAGKTYYDTVYAALSHASRHQSGGADAIKLDDLSAPDDNTALDASTSKHGLMPKFPGGAVRLTGDKTWDTPTFGADLPFGDGVSVIEGSAQAIRIPIAANIVAARIRSFDATGAKVSGSITCALYMHYLGSVLGSVVDTFVLSSAEYYEETGLNVAVPAGRWLTIVVSGITSCKQIVCSLELEGT